VLIYDFYGQDKTADAQWKKAFKISTQWVGPDDAQVEAVIIGAREYKINLTPVVLTPDGALVADLETQVAHANPAVDPVGTNDGRGVQTENGLAELFTTTEAGVNGLQLGGGSKIGDDGPVDEVWVAGKYQGKSIRSQSVKTGLYGTDVVLSPVFKIAHRGGTVPPVQPPTGGSEGGLTKNQIADAMVALAQAVRNLP